MKELMHRSHTLKQIFILIFFTILAGCRIDFIGDLYTSDLKSLANDNEDKSFYLPMQISFQVTACEDLDQVNRIISTYFTEYKNTGCSMGEDFMSYTNAQVSVPVVNKYEIFNNLENSLIGFVSYLSEDKQKIFVDAIINSDFYESLQNYVYNESFTDLSLAESNLSVKLNNDLDISKIEVPPSFVDSQPIVFSETFTMERRDLITIKVSDVNTLFLEENMWTPIFSMIN